jgi:hypothetical protein
MITPFLRVPSGRNFLGQKNLRDGFSSLMQKPVAGKKPVIVEIARSQKLKIYSD